MGEAVILEAVRTPIGKRNGALRAWRPDALYAKVLDALLERTGIDPHSSGGSSRSTSSAPSTPCASPPGPCGKTQRMPRASGGSS